MQQTSDMHIVRRPLSHLVALLDMKKPRPGGADIYYSPYTVFCSLISHTLSLSLSLFIVVMKAQLYRTLLLGMSQPQDRERNKEGEMDREMERGKEEVG